MKKLILSFLLAAACLARTLTPMEQQTARDGLNGYANDAMLNGEYYAYTPEAHAYWEGREAALRSCAYMAYFYYNTTEQLAYQFNWYAQMEAAMAEYETNTVTKANLNGYAAGYNQAYYFIVGF